jgi:RHS repeat-associated protein
VNGVSSNQDALFTMPIPTVTGLTPTAGPVGTSVQIVGTGFGAVQGSSTIQFNSVNATVTSWSDTQITAVVPTTATSGLVRVIVGGVSSVNNIDFTIPPPQVNSVSPAVGIGGTQITISGSGFQAIKGTSSTLSINQTSATTTSWSDTQIIANVPSNPTTGAAKVTVNGITSNADVLFTVPNPIITSVTPSGGAEGSQIQVNGTGFGGASGVLLDSYTYDAFGNVTASLGSFVNPYLYTGRDQDSETGLRYYRARYYDPQTGRFISEDPMGFEAGNNFYVYVSNDPIQWKDSLGLCKSCGLKVAPEYKDGTLVGKTGFHWHAEFLNDDTYDPKCCEVRQYVSWNQLHKAPHIPHEGFAPTSQPNTWYEDRTQDGLMMGRRSGPHAYRDPFSNNYHGNQYDGTDDPDGFDHGDILKFHLNVVDVCNGHIIYTSKTRVVEF